MKHFLSAATLSLLILMIGITTSFADVDTSLQATEQALQQGNTDEALRSLLSAVRAQQETIEGLRSRVGQQEDTILTQQESMEMLGRKIADQENLIRKQEEIIASQQQEISEGKVARTEIISTVEELQKAQELYDRAYQTRRTGIFDVRRGDKEPYFRKAIEQFQYVAEKYPASRIAADAQYQAGSIYQRWLGEPDSAAREYRKVIENWPDSSFAQEAKEALADLGASAND